MSSIREKVARAIAGAHTPQYRELRGDDLERVIAYRGVDTDIAIHTFLEAAADQLLVKFMI